MDDNAYTTEELQQAMRELNYSSFQGDFLKIAEQAVKNRIVKQRTGFTEEQVRKAVTASVHRPGDQEVRTKGAYWSVDTFAMDVINRLREPEAVPAPVEGAVYRSPANVLYKRSGDSWLLFGTSSRLAGDQLNYPVSEMERVL